MNLKLYHIIYNYIKLEFKMKENKLKLNNLIIKLHFLIGIMKLMNKKEKKKILNN